MRPCAWRNVGRGGARGGAGAAAVEHLVAACGHAHLARSSIYIISSVEGFGNAHLMHTKSA